MKPKKAKRLGARRALIVIAMLFAASGLLRLSGDTGKAIAREVASLAPSPQSQEQPSCAPEMPKLSQEILDDLRAREEKVAQAEARQKQTAHSLALAKADIETGLTEMRAAQEALRTTLTLAETAAQEDLERLTAVYENMKPKEAATLFGQMSPDFAAGFMSMMRPDAAAQIMAALEPPKAYAISVVLAGRNAKDIGE